MDPGRSTVALDFRGRGAPERLSVEREQLMELPESVLLCLFPNGVVLSPQRSQLRDLEDREDEEDVYYVEVSPSSLLISVLHAQQTPPPVTIPSGWTPSSRSRALQVF